MYQSVIVLNKSDAPLYIHWINSKTTNNSWRILPAFISVLGLIWLEMTVIILFSWRCKISDMCQWDASCSKALLWLLESIAISFPLVVIGSWNLIHTKLGCNSGFADHIQGWYEGSIRKWPSPSSFICISRLTCIEIGF